MPWRSLFGRRTRPQVDPTKPSPAPVRESGVGKWLKNVSVLVVLALYFPAEIIFSAGGWLMAVYVLVAGGFAVAVLLLALSALAWKWCGQELSPRLGLRFLLCGPPALAVVSSLATIYYYVTYRGHYVYCVDDENCLTLETAIRFSDRFVLYVVIALVLFYLVLFVAAGFVRLLQINSRRELSDQISSERKGS